MLSRKKEFFFAILFLVIVKFEDIYGKNASDILISEEVGKGGKRYFIQYRRLGNSDTYVNVRQKAFVPPYSPQNSQENDYDYEESPSGLRMKVVDRRKDMQYRILDSDWNYDMNKTDFVVPELAYELYKLMQQNDRQSIHNASVIKCLFDSDYAWVDDNIFEFDLSSLKSGEDLEIIDAELHVYRIQDGTNSTYTKKVDHMIRLYQRLPVNDTDDNSTLADLHKLLSVRYISSTYEGWQTFKVKSAVDSWLGGDTNLGLLISATDTAGNDVDLNYADRDRSSGEYTPILTVYFREKNQHPKEYREGKDTKNSLPMLRPFVNRLTNGEEHCSRYVWYVNFEDIGWDTFIVAPKGYMAYRCQGSCSYPFIKDHTNYAKILRFHLPIDKRIQAPRCSPTSYRPLVVMFYDKNQNIVIKTYEDMIVEKCGCR